MAGRGYPGEPLKGTVINGLDEAAKLAGVTIFHAGTKREHGKILANGGRVLAVTALGDTAADAYARAYAAIDRIDWPEGFCRRDIRGRAGPHRPNLRTPRTPPHPPAPPIPPRPRPPPAAGIPHELAPGVHWLRMPLPFPPDHINLWLLADGESWVVVDTGLCRDDGKAHWENIFATTLQGRPVTRVIVTHFHPDHMGMAAWICARWDCELWMTAGEWYMARSVPANGSPADIATRVAFSRGSGVAETGIRPVAESHHPP